MRRKTTVRSAGSGGEPLSSRPIPIVADIPSSNPRLGFQEYVAALADAIVGGEPAQFTVGLYGAWGTGKSSLLHALHSRLTRAPSVTPVLFDAWRYERNDHIVVPLLHAVHSALDQEKRPEVAAQVAKAVKALMFSLSFSLGVANWDGGAFRKNWEELDVSVPLDAAFDQPFAQLRGVSDVLDGHRVAVLIDDLDRCSPAKVVSLLEAINVVMDVNGFIFVLAIDYDVLVDAVRKQHPHVSGHDFIEKIVQLPFRVPPLAEHDARLLGELVPGLESALQGLPRARTLPATLHDVAVMGLRANPRQIKRLVNSLLVIHRIVELRKLAVNYELLAAMIGVQLRWPTAHHEFQEAVRLGIEHPVSVFTESDDDELKRYAGRFFGGSKLGRDDLRRLVQLTAVVAAESSSEDVKGSSDTPTTVGELAARLEARGFREVKSAKGKDRLFRRAGLPNHQVAVAAKEIRYERRVQRRWQPWHVFKCTPTGMREALKAVDNPQRYSSKR